MTLYTPSRPSLAHWLPPSILHPYASLLAGCCMLLAFAYSLIWLVWQLRPILQNVICQGRLVWAYDHAHVPAASSPSLPTLFALDSQVFSLWLVEWFEVCAQWPSRRDPSGSGVSFLPLLLLLLHLSLSLSAVAHCFCDFGMSCDVWICLVWSVPANGRGQSLYIYLARSPAMSINRLTWTIICGPRSIDIWPLTVIA